MGDSTFHSMRTFRLISSASCGHEFQNLHYVPVEERRFHDVRIEFLTSDGLHIPFEDSTKPSKFVLHFRKNTSGNLYNTRLRHHLESYNHNQADRPLSPTTGIGHV